MVRQLLGAVGGMLAAGALYVAIQQLSSVSLSQALLISPTNVSQNAQRVRVNDKNVDDETLRRIAQHAQSVAAVFKGQQTDESPTEVAASSASVQQLQSPLAYVSANQATQLERIQFRNALAQAERNGQPAPSAPVPLAEASSSSASAVAFEPVPVTMPLTQETTATPEIVTSKNGLPNSGLGLNILITLSLFLALALTRPDLRQRMVAVLRATH